MSTHARCCNPVPPEPITGYVTVGRGITLHRTGCRNLARLAARAPQRLLQVDWGKSKGRRYPVEIVVHAMDRRGLCATSRRWSRRNTSTSSGCLAGGHVPGQCRPVAACRRGGLPELSRLLARLSAMPASSAPGAVHETKGLSSGSGLSDWDIDRPLVCGEGGFVHGFRVSGARGQFAAGLRCSRNTPLQARLRRSVRPPSVR